MFSLSNDSPVSVKIFVAILVIAAVPAYAQAQTRSTPGDAQKVAKIIRSDKTKIKTYCEINQVSEEMNQAYAKNDKKRLDELFQEIERSEKILGPENVALMDGLQGRGPENNKRVAEVLAQFAALDRLCTIRVFEIGINLGAKKLPVRSYNFSKILLIRPRCGAAMPVPSCSRNSFHIKFRSVPDIEGNGLDDCFVGLSHEPEHRV
jgi:hypothetical protein